jgi:hypothetical protein
MKCNEHAVWHATRLFAAVSFSQLLLKPNMLSLELHEHRFFNLPGAVGV